MDKKRIFPISAAFVIICAMVGSAQFFNESEIIFPEIAAIAVGSLISPKFAWNTSKIRMLLSIMICAFSGVAIVLFVPIPLYLQIALAFLIGRTVLMLLKVSFAPMVSAIVLPVLLGTKSPVYLISAFVLTLLIISVRLIFEKAELFEPNKFIKHEIDFKKQILSILISTLFVLILAFAGVKSSYKFIVAPPLLVAFTEFQNPKSKARKTPVISVTVITLCALAGAVSRFLISEYLGLPLVISAFVCFVFVLLILNLSELYLPPAAATGILAMLIKSENIVLFPVQVLIGCSVLMLFDILIFKEKKREV